MNIIRVYVETFTDFQFDAAICEQFFNIIFYMLINFIKIQRTKMYCNVTNFKFDNNRSKFTLILNFTTLS